MLGLMIALVAISFIRLLLDISKTASVIEIKQQLDVLTEIEPPPTTTTTTVMNWPNIK